jgi:hypothetical protein
MDAQATVQCCALRTGGFLQFFGDLPDPRAANCIHKLSDIFAIAICAVICGAEGWVDVALFAESKRAWLGTFLETNVRIYSVDDSGRRGVVFLSLEDETGVVQVIVWKSLRE